MSLCARHTISLFFVYLLFLCHGWRFPLVRNAGLRIRASYSFQLHGFQHHGIQERAVECLDLTELRHNLRLATITTLGRSMISNNYHQNAKAVLNGYAKIQQLEGYISSLPLNTSVDLWNVVDVIENNTRIPDKDDLELVSSELQNLVDLYTFMNANNRSLDLFQKEITYLKLPIGLIAIFNTSFADNCNLNPEKYPVIRAISQQIDKLERQIFLALHSLIRSSTLQDKLADVVYREVEGRYCLLFKNTHKHGYGIVHGTSNSGRTAYVEPFQIIESTNELKALKAELKQEENRILTEMCQTLFTYRKEIRGALRAMASVDIIRAKALIGQQLHGIIPEVKEEGCIDCVDAKHPLLLLQQHQHKNSMGETEYHKEKSREVIGNSLQLNVQESALIISGPNAGGKTLVLKTCGLLGWLVKYAIPIPAQEGSRFDYFHDILADIGDSQSVSNDVSTFSGHLSMCRDILSVVQSQHHHRASSHYSLIILDELGTGTDPHQGAALAQAILEQLINSTEHTRVVLSTHFATLKELAYHDPRFRIAAMEFIHDEPTYRLVYDYIGQSYAFELASRMHFPVTILSRARQLLSEENQRLIFLQEELHKQLTTIKQLEQNLTKQITQQKEHEVALTRKQYLLDEEIAAYRQGHRTRYIEDFLEKEKYLQQLMDNLSHLNRSLTANLAPTSSHDQSLFSDAILNNETNFLSLSKELQSERLALSKSYLTDRNLLQQHQAEALPSDELANIGDRLLILSPGEHFGCYGFVMSKDKGRTMLNLRVTTKDDKEIGVKVERYFVAKPIKSTASSSLCSSFSAASALAEDNKMLKRIEKYQKQQMRQQQKGSVSMQSNFIELTSQEKELLKLLNEDTQSSVW